MSHMQEIVTRLNDAVARDWQAMHRLVESRVPASPRLANHPTIIVVPHQSQDSITFSVGMLGVLNGVCCGTDDPPIEAVFDDAGELIGFRLRGDGETVDHRAVAFKDMRIGQVYRVRDRLGQYFIGPYLGSGDPPQESGIRLQQPQGRVALIYFHDASQVIQQ